MRTLADFRRAATEGSRWRVDNNLRPSVSGTRTIRKAQAKSLKYDAVTDDGRDLGAGWLDFPKADAVRIDGDSVHFLYEPGSDRVAFTWTLIPSDTP